MSTSPNLLITDISASQNQKEVTHNDAIHELDLALTNLLSVAMADANVTLTTGEGNQALANMVFVFTGANTAARNVIVPTNKKLYIVGNGTTGGFKITVKTASGTGVDILASDGYVLCYCDGTNVVKIVGGASSSTGGVSTKTADYTIVGGDNGKTIVLTSGSHTFTPPAPSTSIFVFVENVGSGTLTLSRNSHNINGAAADQTFSQGQGALLVSDGTDYFLVTGLGSGAAIGGVSTKTADYTIVGGDNGKTIALTSGSHTFTPPAPATTIFVFLENVGSGTLTLSRNSHNINGAASDVTFSQGQGALLVSDGTDYFLITGLNGSGSTTLAGLTDVAITSATNNDVLTYESSSSLWKNKPASGGGGGGTPLQKTQRQTRLVADGSTTTLNSVGDSLAISSGSPVARVPTSTRGAAVEYGAPSGDKTFEAGPGANNYRTGRHVAFVFNGYLSTTGDSDTWIYVGTDPGGNATNDIADVATPGATSHTDYAGFRCFNRSGASMETTWQAATGDGTTDNVQDTGVTQDTSGHRFAIVFDDDNSQVLFYIDGVLKATSTTNLPRASKNMALYISSRYQTTQVAVGVTQIDAFSDL